MHYLGKQNKMRLYRQLADFKGSDKPLAIAIGNFDGYHKGHQAVIAAMQAKAKALDLYSAVMIFEPQPLEYFGRAVPPRLFALRDKLKAFKKAGVDIVVCIPFKKAFSDLNAKDFVCDILYKRLNVRSITVGSLFSFGKGGIYTIEDLKAHAQELNMEASAISGVAADGTRVSSTMIRALIESGDFKTAYDMTGHEYSISGRVVHGNEIGRTIGFPTANVNLNRRVCALRGVYAVLVNTSLGQFKGVANVGFRPTISSQNFKSLLEVNIFDFHHNIYGSEIEVIFKAKIRDEKKFQSLNSLMQQIKADCNTALQLLV